MNFKRKVTYVAMYICISLMYILINQNDIYSTDTLAFGELSVDSNSSITNIGAEDAEVLPQLLVRFTDSAQNQRDENDPMVAQPQNLSSESEVTEVQPLIPNLVNWDNVAESVATSLTNQIRQSDQPINGTMTMDEVEPRLVVNKVYDNFKTAVLDLNTDVDIGVDIFSQPISDLVPASPEELAIINETISQAKDIQEIESIQKVRIFDTTAQTTPNFIKRIGATDGILKVGDGTNKIVNSNIAILDTGISEHPDLHIVEARSFVNNNINDNCGHGTHVAGIAAAKDNDIGVVGTAPGANLYNLKVLEKQSNGKCKGPETAIIAALDYIIGKDIDVINLSLGAKCSDVSCNADTYEKAINDVIADGKIVVVAAGNKAEDANNFLPARFTGAITVSAISDSDGLCGGVGNPTSWARDDRFAPFSNFGTAVDIAAPGVDILSTYLNSGYGKLSGTSMASPIVAGIIATYKTIHPESDLSSLLNSILSASTTVDTICSENRGYIIGDTKDPYSEPLLYVKNIQ